MKIGVISDTHGLVRPEVYTALDGVDLILHAGDIGGMDVIVELTPLAPVRAVAGNNDPDLLHKFQEEMTFAAEGKSFRLLHIFRDIPDPEEPGLQNIQRVVVFGHSHKPVNQQTGDTLYFNPGSAGPRRFNLPVTVGRLELTGDTVKSSILHLL